MSSENGLQSEEETEDNYDEKCSLKFKTNFEEDDEVETSQRVYLVEKFSVNVP